MLRAHCDYTDTLSSIRGTTSHPNHTFGPSASTATSKYTLTPLSGPHSLRMAREPTTPIFGLPLELRGMIYDYTFEQPCIQVFSSAETQYLSPALLSVNRQVRAEASVRFYKRTTFYAYWYQRGEVLKRWLRVKPQAVRDLICRVEIKTGLREKKEMQAYLCWVLEAEGIKLRSGVLSVVGY